MFCKEFLENLRDRRTLLSALLFGPLFGPLLFGAHGVAHAQSERGRVGRAARRSRSPAAQHAPGLIRYLESQRRQAHARANCRRTRRGQRVSSGGAASGAASCPRITPALFADASPAPVLLIADSSDSQTRKIADRAARAARGATAAPSRNCGCEMRGVSPLLGVPVAVNEIDVDDARRPRRGGAGIHDVLRAVRGVDGRTVPGDRFHRGRARARIARGAAQPAGGAFSALVGGKILATCAYMCLSLAINLTAFVCVFRFVPLERLGMSANLGARHRTDFLRDLPALRALGRRADDLVASFTRSYREAQTYLTTVLLVPTLPIAFASIYSLKTKSSLMIIPSLSQHLLMTSVLKDEPIAPLDVGGLRRLGAAARSAAVRA